MKQHLGWILLVILGSLLVWDLFLHDIVLGADGKSGFIGGFFKH